MSGDGATIRRRRVCSACKKRFTTYERVEEAAPMVVKKMAAASHSIARR